jgi:hypothetical protein
MVGPDEARLDRIATAMEHAEDGMRLLLDVVGCHAETGRDAWMFRNDAFDHDAFHQSIDILDGKLTIGRLTIPLESEIRWVEESTTFHLDGETWTIDSADLEGNGPYGIDMLSAARMRWESEGSDLIVEHEGSTIRLGPKDAVVGTTGEGTWGICIPKASIDVCASRIGTNGIALDESGRAEIMPHGGSRIVLRTNRLMRD